MASNNSTAEEREQAAFLNDAGMSHYAIAKMLGRSYTAVRSWFNEEFRLSMRQAYKRHVSTPLGDAKRRLQSSQQDSRRGGYAQCTATPEEVLAAKTEACPGCKRQGERMVLDHCHETGKLRGWLCNDCNTVLGYARENTQTLLNLVEYLT